MQTGVTVSGKNITGELAYLTSGGVVSEFGQPGNYLALKFSNVDSKATSVKVGLRPTYKTGEPVDDDSGLVELLGDPEMNGVFKITDKDTQKFIVVTTDGKRTKRDEYNLSGLTLNVAQVAKLTSLSVGSLVLDPTFDPDTISYTANTINASNVVHASADDELTISIELNGSPINEGSSARWSEGSNTLEITVSGDGYISNTYTVVVTYEVVIDGTLESVTINNVTLTANDFTEQQDGTLTATAVGVKGGSGTPIMYELSDPTIISSASYNDNIEFDTSYDITNLGALYSDSSKMVGSINASNENTNKLIINTQNSSTDGKTVIPHTYEITFDATATTQLTSIGLGSVIPFVAGYSPQYTLVFDDGATTAYDIPVAERRVDNVAQLSVDSTANISDEFGWVSDDQTADLTLEHTTPGSSPETISNYGTVTVKDGDTISADIGAGGTSLKSYTITTKIPDYASFKSLSVMSESISGLKFDYAKDAFVNTNAPTIFTSGDIVITLDESNVADVSQIKLNGDIIAFTPVVVVGSDTTITIPASDLVGKLSMENILEIDIDPSQSYTSQLSDAKYLINFNYYGA